MLAVEGRPDLQKTLNIKEESVDTVFVNLMMMMSSFRAPSWRKWTLSGAGS